MDDEEQTELTEKQKLLIREIIEKLKVRMEEADASPEVHQRHSASAKKGWATRRSKVSG